jgi:hypothetical protein
MIGMKSSPIKKARWIIDSLLVCDIRYTFFIVDPGEIMDLTDTSIECTRTSQARGPHFFIKESRKLRISDTGRSIRDGLDRNVGRKIKRQVERIKLC